MVLPPCSWRQAIVRQTIAFDYSNPSVTYKINPHPKGWGFILWRSRRDLNPRYPFGVHTISSRARYDHFDTAPWLRRSCRLAYDTITDAFCQVLILQIFRSAAIKHPATTDVVTGFLVGVPEFEPGAPWTRNRPRSKIRFCTVHTERLCPKFSFFKPSNHYTIHSGNNK